MTTLRRMLSFLAFSLYALAAGAAQAQNLTIGTSAGPMSDILTFAARQAEAQGLKVRIVTFSDWITPNEALRAGDLDANFFQNEAFLNTQKAARGYDFSVISKGVILPTGIYSKTVKSLDDVPQNAKAAIANDPLNSARGLLLLQKAGLIKLKDGGSLSSTVRDIVDNPKNISIVQVEGPQLARVADDVHLATIGLTILIPAGGDPKSALLSEDYTQEEFAVALVARNDRKSDPRLVEFVQVFNSAETKAFVQEKFPAFIPTW